VKILFIVAAKFLDPYCGVSRRGKVLDSRRSTRWTETGDIYLSDLKLSRQV